ncbi:MAG: tRNA preQ1(34) S-adenosylmethionine ribosyltransferase-isomerase QueA [bacterium]|nr:tRNA preQ1(34) S-adenosylmethionine ribosyltransferase-isomerase QueA [bacterium]MDE0288366.1 tRNA preQ1(34) S-adenosylmethionine ribosyltransferase-isomerase QueA [bacterium]MDE0438694.1 tRNA preQ1(34) S-adenosylmethionine ribosyltransferase-isomerase QueA [bacterium]
MRTAEFVYDLPPGRIAQSPVKPRDSARLLRGSDLTHWTVGDLPGLLRPGDLVVVNETRVRAARLIGRRDPTGGRVEILLVGRERSTWKALLRPARRIRAESVILVGPLTARVVTDPVAGMVELELELEDGGNRWGDIEAAIAGIGEVPLPPYIHRTLDDPERYQTVFGSRVGSAAAPTAGLHLTQRTLGGLADREIGTARVELQIGIDTFRPITVENVADHEMHSERIDVPEVTVNRILETRSAGGRVVAVGTTVVRALETAGASDRIAPFRGPTSLYITPGYRFAVVDLLLTNFHMPKSSLLVLVAAFVGDSWRRIYRTALESGYRFLSFGDAMLLERSEVAVRGP